MNLKTTEHFHRDDYSVAIGDMRQMIDADTGAEFWQVDTIIYVDDMVYKYHGFRTTRTPDRSHLTQYMNVIVPEIFAHDAHS